MNNSKSPFDRRDFLKALLAAGTALSPSAWASPTKKRDARILVLGAGTAGLAAARDLAAEGFEVIVLEGRDRLGGRIHTDRSLGVAVDLGASWIHGIRRNPIKRLAEEAGVRTEECNPESYRLHDADGAPISDAKLIDLSADFDRLMVQAWRWGRKQEADVSIAQGFEAALQGKEMTPFEERALRHLQTAAIETAAAEDLSNLSLWSASEGGGFGGAEHIFPDGYDQLIDHLARGQEIRMEQRVRRIEKTGDGVRVETDGDAFEADAALVTFPLGVLQRGDLIFEPGLPAAKKEAVDRLAMGTINKIVLRFPEVFWDRSYEILGWAASLQGETPPFFYLADSSTAPVLIVFHGGSAARETESRSPEDLAARTMKVLRTIHGSKIPEPDAVLATRWAADPFSYGSYAHLPVGATSKDRRRLAEPMGKHFFFAGEAANAEYPATVHGAYLSGVQEAQRIAEAFR